MKPSAVALFALLVPRLAGAIAVSMKSVPSVALFALLAPTLAGAIAVAPPLARPAPAGCPAPLAALPIGSSIEGYRETHAFTAERLSTRPTCVLLRNFLSEVECKIIMAEAELSGALHPAETSGGTDARRNCDVCTLPPQKSAAVAAITREVAGLLLDPAAAALPGSGSEDLHVLRYAPGGEFRPHFDAMAAPRVLTVLYYLNGVGATWFPLADASTDALDFGDREAVLRHVSTLDPSRDGLLVEPAAPGDALAFYNFEANGAPDMHALHAGVEVGAGSTKWVASHFFRAPGVVTPAARNLRAVVKGSAVVEIPVA